MTGPEMLKLLRVRHDYSQEQVAREVGVSLGAVSQWERGLTTPRRSRVERLDAMLHADGALMRAFGLAAEISSLDDGDVLRRVERLERLVLHLAQQLRETAEVRVIAEELDELEAQIAAR